MEDGPACQTFSEGIVRRKFESDLEKAHYHADKAIFWSRVSIAFAIIALVASIVGAVLRAS